MSWLVLEQAHPARRDVCIRCPCYRLRPGSRSSDWFMMHCAALDLPKSCSVQRLSMALLVPHVLTSPQPHAHQHSLHCLHQHSLHCSHCRRCTPAAPCIKSTWAYMQGPHCTGAQRIRGQPANYGTCMLWCACGVHVVCMWCACGVHARLA
jgi:hypothetical protein